MKYLILIITLFFTAQLSAQSITVIASTTTVDSLNVKPKGTYRFFSGPQKDTVDFNLDSQVCPSCPTVPVCPVCPTCPVVPVPRTWTGMTINTKTGVVTVTYSSGPPSTHTLLNPIVIQ